MRERKVETGGLPQGDHYPLTRRSQQTDASTVTKCFVTLNDHELLLAIQS